MIVHIKKRNLKLRLMKAKIIRFHFRTEKKYVKTLITSPISYEKHTSSTQKSLHTMQNV